MMESLVEIFKTGKMIRSDAFFISDQNKYQLKKENDSRHLWSAAGIGVVLEEDAQQVGEVMKQMNHFKLKKAPRLNWDSNRTIECKQEKFFNMHPASVKKLLLLNICTSKESNGDRCPTAWYCIDLSKMRCEGDNWVVGKMDLRIKMPQNSPYPRMCAALGSVIYIIGGNSSITRIYYLDTSNSENEWIEGPSMNIHREIGSIVVHEGKIYVFGGYFDYTEHNPWFGEVYDPVLNSWDPMTDPLEELGQWQGRFDGIYKDRKILVHPCSNKTLYAYDVVDKSWQALDCRFGCWHRRGVIMDDVLYVFDYMKVEIRGYDLIRLKWCKSINLDSLEWFSRTQNSEEVALEEALFFKVEAKVLCFVYFDWKRGGGLEIYCKTFTIKKITQEDGDVVLEAEVFSSTIYNLGETTKRNLIGIWNFTNLGVVSHNEILEMYKKYIEPEFKWANSPLKSKLK